MSWLVAPFELLSGASILLVAAIALVLALMVAPVMRADEKVMRERGAGIIAFELARTRRRAHTIMTGWGDAGRSAARRDLSVDLVLIAAYAIGFSALLSAAVAGIEDRAWSWWAVAGRIIAWAALVSGLFDLVENSALAMTLRRRTDTPESLGGWPRIAWLAACVKFGLLALCAAWAVLVLWPLLVPGRT